MELPLHSSCYHTCRHTSHFLPTKSAGDPAFLPPSDQVRHRSSSSSSSWHARHRPRASFLLLARGPPSQRLLPPPGTRASIPAPPSSSWHARRRPRASFLLLEPVPPPPRLLPPPSTCAAAAAPPCFSCHARRRPDLSYRTLLPGSCRRPAHITTSSGHCRAPISPGSHTATHLVLVGHHNRTTPVPRSFNATTPVRSLQQHPGSSCRHVVPTTTFDGAPRLSPAAGRPNYCTVEGTAGDK